MNKLKKLSAVLLSSVIILCSLSACSDKESKEVKSDSKETSTSETSTSNTSESTVIQDKEAVPYWVGMDYQEVINDEYNQKHFSFTKEERFSDTDEKGVIMYQSIVPGTLVTKDEKINLVVSIGAESIAFPSGIKGMKFEDAKATLEALGFTVDDAPMTKPNPGNYESGTVADHPSFTEGAKYERGAKVLLAVWE